VSFKPLSSQEQSFQYRTEGQGRKIAQGHIIIKQIVSRTPKTKEWVGRVPDEEGVFPLDDQREQQNANAGIAKRTYPPSLLAMW